MEQRKEKESKLEGKVGCAIVGAIPVILGVAGGVTDYVYNWNPNMGPVLTGVACAGALPALFVVGAAGYLFCKLFDPDDDWFRI